MSSVLLIEDDLRIRESVVSRIAAAGHHIESESKAMAGVERALSGGFDVVVLDLGLPDLDGIDALSMIRAVSDIPIVVATARDEEAEIVRVLDAGADDYLVKPYGAEQLLARIRAVLRRSVAEEDQANIVVGDLRFDLGAREASMAEVSLDLTAREFDLLLYLAERPGKLVSKRELLAAVWRQPYGGADKTIDVHLSWLRKKLGETAAEPRYIHTRRGVGVMLRAPNP